MMTTNIAQRLYDARHQGTLVDDKNYPTTLAEAYDCQESISRLSGCSINGFKIGATVPATMELLGVNEPFFGPLFEEYTYESGQPVPLHARHTVQLETEFVIGLRTAVKRSQSDNPAANLTIDDIRNATDWIAGGFELIGTRYKTTPEKRGLSAIADSGVNVAMILGPRNKQWHSLDLSQHPATLYVNDKEITTGHSGMSIAGNPLGMVAWLANHPRLRTRGLVAGDMITCGTCSGVLPVKASDTLRADFGELGEISASLVEA